MSATNRGTKRINADFYPTPESAFKPLIEHLPSNRDYWEPACGDGRLIKWLNESGRKSNGSDIRDGYNFLIDTLKNDIIITNPPFSLAFEFCQHAVKHASEAYILLRLNFLASKERKKWWKENEPSAIFVLSERPSFIKSCKCRVGDGGCGHEWVVPSEENPAFCPVCFRTKIRKTKSDACDYAWFAWGSEKKGFFHL